jgi:hypothetical protein
MTESAPHLRMTAGEVPADIPSMDLARFLLNSLYGSILRSTTETTDQLAAHDACSLLATDAVLSNN